MQPIFTIALEIGEHVNRIRSLQAESYAMYKKGQKQDEQLPHVE